MIKLRIINELMMYCFLYSWNGFESCIQIRIYKIPRRLFGFVISIFSSFSFGWSLAHVLGTERVGGFYDVEIERGYALCNLSLEHIVLGFDLFLKAWMAEDFGSGWSMIWHILKHRYNQRLQGVGDLRALGHGNARQMLTPEKIGPVKYDHLIVFILIACSCERIVGEH